MYCGILKIVFDDGPRDGSLAAGATKDLCQSIRKKFRVLAKPEYKTFEHVSIVVVSLEVHEQHMRNLFEKVIAHSENFGIGRVVSDEIFIEDISQLDEED